MKSRSKKVYIANILMAIFIATAIVPLMNAEACSNVVIDWNDIHQEIDGFGITQDEEDTYSMSEPQRTEVMDLLYSRDNGIGLSILRTEIGCGDSKATIEPDDGVWNYEPDMRELWYFNEAKVRGVEKIFGTVWSPPAWMKTNNKLERGGFLKKEYYQKYADYLAQYIKIYKEYHGVDIYGVSIANEPEYAAPWKSCLWTGSMFKNFIKDYLKPTFENENIDAKVIAGEMAIWSEVVVKDALKDPESCSRVDIVAAHQYQGIIKELPTAKKTGKKIWMTELSDTTGGFDTGMSDALKWGKKIHKFMTIPEISAFCYWRGSHTVNDNQTLIHINPDLASYIVSKRLFTLGHFSRFVRPGYVRIGATDNPTLGVYITAYKDIETGNFAIVAINDSKYDKTLDIVPKGFVSGQITPYITNEQVDMEKRSDIKSIDEKFTISLEGKSITTFIGINEK
jgi:glucuronoarabinoxylan endo-1,4-beta-xylanase